MKRVNLGVIGCGHIAESAHIPNALALPEARLVAIADVDEGRLTTIKNKFGIRESYKNYVDLIKRDDIDAVIICTPTETHEKITLEAIECGKHVFVEKPMATSLEGAEKIYNASKKFGVKVMVGLQHRFLPNHRIAKRIIRKGEIGEIYYGEAHGETLVVKPEDGTLLDYGIHLIDLLCWYFSDLEVKKVAAFFNSSRGFENESEVVVTIIFNNNLIGQVRAFWMGNIQSWEAVDRYVKILGSKGKIVSELTGPHFTLYKEGSIISKIRGPHKILPKRSINPYLPLTQIAYRIELEHFLRCIIEDKKPETDASEGLKLMRIIEAAKKSFVEEKFIRVRIST